MSRDELIDRVEELFWESPFMQLGEPRDLAKVVIPLIEVDLREQIASQIHSIGATALGVFTDEYQGGLAHATLTALTGDGKHPARYTPEERQQMFGRLNAIARGGMHD